MPETVQTFSSPSDWKTRALGLLFALGAQLLFGTTFAANKWVINNEVDPFVLGFLRMIFATLFLFPFFWGKRNSASWNRSDWGRAVFVGAGACAIAMALEYVGTGLTSASNVSLIVSTEVVVAVFLSVLILKERLYANAVIGGVLAFAGVLMVVFRDILRVDFLLGEHLAGDFLVMGSVIGWGLYTVYSKRIVLHSSPTYSLFYVSFFAAVSLGAMSAVQGLLPQILTMNWQTWLVTFYLGAFCSGLGHLLYYQALKRLPASNVALTLALLPVFGVTFAVILLDEALYLLQAFGGALIVFGVIYAVWPRSTRPYPSETQLHSEGN